MGKKQVLIVDDELQVARALRAALESRLGTKCQVEISNDPMEAMEKLKNQHYDLLVTDLRMPGINGMDLLKYAHSHDQNLRAILITAFGSPDLEQKVQELQAQYIPKPFNLQDFIVITQQLLEDNRPQIIILVNGDPDVINARQKVREVARTLGLNVTDQARISMATSSIAYALKMGSTHVGQIRIEWIVDTQGRGIRVTCTTTDGKSIELPPSAVKDVAWMVDQLTVDPLPSQNTQVVLIKYV